MTWRVEASAGAESAAAFAALGAVLGVPATPYIGLFGDSRVFDCHTTDDATQTIPPAQMVPVTRDDKPSQGFAAQLETISYGRVEFPRSMNYGIAGQTTPQMVLRSAANMAAIKAAGGSAVVILASTNDPGGSITIAQTIANLTQIETDAINAGLIVIWLAEYPRGDTANSSSGLTGNALRDHMAARKFLLGRANNRNVFVVDPWIGVLADPTSASGWLKDGYSRDGLHLNGVGSQYVAAALLPLIQALWPARSILPASNADIYATQYVQGALTPNPMLTGTGGTLASGVTGSLADSWGQGALPASLACAASKGTDAKGVPYQQFDLSGTPANFATFNMLQKDTAIGTQGLAIGSTVRAVAEVEIAAGLAGCYDIDLFVGANTLNARTYASSPNVSTSAPPLQLVQGVFITPTIVVPSGTVSVRAALRAYMKGTAVTASIKVKRLALLAV